MNFHKKFFHISAKTYKHMLLFNSKNIGQTEQKYNTNTPSERKVKWT